MGMQRSRARQSFQAGLQLPEILNLEEIPLATLQKMAEQFEKGYDLPYPRQPAATPTSGMEGMTFDPNRQATVQPPANMPLELVAPRSLEESSLRQAGIQGKSAAEQTLSGLQHYGEQMPRMEGFFEDVGEDPGEYDIPASVGGFQRYPMPDVAGPAKPGESYGPLEWDPRIGSYRQQELGTGEWKTVGKAPGEGGAGEDPEAEEYKRALDTYKALNQRLDPVTGLMLQNMGANALKDPSVQDRIKGKLTAMEQKQLEYALQYIDYYQNKRRGQLGLGQIPTEQTQAEAATAESFLKKHIGQ
jgi:hypothetical protein